MKLTFSEWMTIANERVYNEIGIGISELPDWNWRDAYDDGRSVKSAVKEFLKGANDEM